MSPSNMPSVNNIMLTGIVRTAPNNFSKDPAKFWWSIPVVMTDLMHDGQPFHQTVKVTVFNSAANAVASQLVAGDEILVAGKLRVKNSKDQSGNWKTDVDVVNGLNQTFALLTRGNPLPQAGQAQARPNAAHQAHGNTYHAHRRPAEQPVYQQPPIDDSIPF